MAYGHVMAHITLYTRTVDTVCLIERGATSTVRWNTSSSKYCLHQFFLHLDVGGAMFNQNQSSIATGGPPSDNDFVLRSVDEAGLICDSND